MVYKKFTIKQRNSFKFFTFELFESDKQIGNFSVNECTINSVKYSIILGSALYPKSELTGISVYQGKTLKARMKIKVRNYLIAPLLKEKMSILKKIFIMKPVGVGNLGMEIWDEMEKNKIAEYKLKGILKKEDIITIYDKMINEEINLLICALFYRHQYYLS